MAIVVMSTEETIARILVNQLTQELILKGQASQISVEAILTYPDIPDTAHEFTTILQFGSSHQMVEWLGYPNKLVASRMAAKLQEQEMI